VLLHFGISAGAAFFERGERGKLRAKTAAGRHGVDSPFLRVVLFVVVAYFPAQWVDFYRWDSLKSVVSLLAIVK
jgi:hypothetical protein